MPPSVIKIFSFKIKFSLKTQGVGILCIFTLTFNNHQWFYWARRGQQQTCSSAGGDTAPVMNCGEVCLWTPQTPLPPLPQHPWVIDTVRREDSSIFCIDEWWVPRRLHTVFSSVCPEEREPWWNLYWLHKCLMSKQQQQLVARRAHEMMTQDAHTHTHTCTAAPGREREHTVQHRLRLFQRRNTFHFILFFWFSLLMNLIWAEKRI